MAATVNGQLVFLNSPLADGDVVEIHTAGSDDTHDADGEPIGPSPDWLTFVRTPHAQLHIERRLRARQANDPERPTTLPFAAQVRIGRAAIHLELRRRGRSLASDMPLLSLAAKLGFPDIETLCVAVADRTHSAEDIAAHLIHQVDSGSIEAVVAAASSRG
jgi:GTP pyrophosphokinase